VAAGPVAGGIGVREQPVGWDDVEIALEDPHTIQVTDTAGRHVVSLQLRQPVCEGPTGIWVVDSGVWLG
jgi:hypothetical protein